jgi:hypothetical protein
MSQLSTKIRPNIMRINIFYQNTMVKIFTASILFAVLLSVSAPAKASNDTRTSDQNTVATVAD